MTIAPTPKSVGETDQCAERTGEGRGDARASAHEAEIGLDTGHHGEGGADLRLPIDWQALRARLFAARQQQVSLDAQSSAERLRLRLRGSFDGCAASVLTTYEAVSRSINLDASSYGKPAQGKDSPVADVTRTGRRGQR